MLGRSRVAQLVFGVAQLEQHQGTIGGIGWLGQRPAQLLGRGVRGTAGERRPRGLPQHRNDVAVAARRRRDEVHRDRTRVGALLCKQLGRTRVQIGLLGG